MSGIVTQPPSRRPCWLSYESTAHARRPCDTAGRCTGSKPTNLSQLSHGLTGRHRLLLGGQQCGLVNTRMEEEPPCHLHMFCFAPAPARVGML
jgi:hypothetical protein